MSKVTIGEVNIKNVWPVVKNMRRLDWIEISNLVPRQICSVDGITMMVVQHTFVGFVVAYDGTPVCVVQLTQKHDGCWSCGLFATDDFDKVWKAVIREVKEIVVPTLLDLEARYCEAMVQADNQPARRFLEWIGFVPKSEVLTNYGAFGKDFILYALTEKELNSVFISKGPGSNSRTHPTD